MMYAKIVWRKSLVILTPVFLYQKAALLYHFVIVIILIAFRRIRFEIRVCEVVFVRLGMYRLSSPVSLHCPEDDLAASLGLRPMCVDHISVRSGRQRHPHTRDEVLRDLDLMRHGTERPLHVSTVHTVGTGFPIPFGIRVSPRGPACPPARAQQTAPLRRGWPTDVPPSPTSGIPAGRTSRNAPQTGLHNVS